MHNTTDDQYWPRDREEDENTEDDYRIYEPTTEITEIDEQDQPVQEQGGYWQWFKRQQRSTRIHIGCTLLVILLVFTGCLDSIFFVPTSSKPAPAYPQKLVRHPTSVPTVQPAIATPALLPQPTITPSPTPAQASVPVAQASPLPMFTATVTASAVEATVPGIPVSTPASRGFVHPALNRPCSAVNCNPWGYNFVKGSYIVSPPASFCAYFRCIRNFWSGKGYVVQCHDGSYSKSGGRRGVCDGHRGPWRVLYRH